MDELIQRLIAQALRFEASGAAPVAPRLAATVMLLRPTDPGFEVFLMRRKTSMAFAAGMYAFPGGAVDPADYDGVPPDAGVVARLARPEAAAVVRAAVREVAEETGVRLCPGDLVPWARWITPEFEPRRFDTHFLLAALPEGQQPAGTSYESDRAIWIHPDDAVAAVAAGELDMLPPTLQALRGIAGYGSISLALTAAADQDVITPVIPRVVREPDGTARFVF